MSSTSHRYLLQESFFARRKKNSNYSMRAYARDLNISHSHLLRVISGKKNLSLKQAAGICGQLSFSNHSRKAFLSSASEALAGGSTETHDRDNFETIELDRFKVVADWQHLAIWTLMSLKDFRPEAKWVARQLGISTREVRTALIRLERIGLIKGWKKIGQFIKIPPRFRSLALASFHNQMIDKAKHALNNKSSREERDISAATVTANPEKINEAHKRIEQFRKELIEFLTEEQGSELYQLNVQFFRLAMGEKK